tara:strand:- start:212 stop:469 length:258 start_codon:yes stop_codon:yes gene_type:complete
MKSKNIFQELLNISEMLNIKIIHEKGNFNGGYCIFKKEKIIVINKLKPIEQKIKAIAKAFNNWDTSNIYIKPAIRHIIESENINN